MVTVAGPLWILTKFPYFRTVQFYNLTIFPHKINVKVYFITLINFQIICVNWKIL